VNNFRLKLRKFYFRLMVYFVFIAGFVLSPSSFADNSKRIISLDLCTDWMLLKYASKSQHITYSPLLYRYKADWVVEGLPVHDGSLEQILEINPDLVISGEFNATLLIKRLRQLTIKTEVMPLPLNLSSIIEYTNKFKSLVRTNHLLEKLLILDTVASNGKKLLLLGENGIGAGNRTLENDIIEKSGWNNYLQAEVFVSLDLEQVVRNPPDAV